MIFLIRFLLPFFVIVGIVPLSNGGFVQGKNSTALSSPTTFSMTPVAGSKVQAAITLTDLADTTLASKLGGVATQIEIHVTNGTPDILLSATLNAGNCMHPSASFTPLATFNATSKGTAVAIFYAPYALSSLTDGSRIISLSSQGILACGEIPKK